MNKLKSANWGTPRGDPVQKMRKAYKWVLHYIICIGVTGSLILLWLALVYLIGYGGLVNYVCLEILAIPVTLGIVACFAHMRYQLRKRAKREAIITMAISGDLSTEQILAMFEVMGVLDDKSLALFKQLENKTPIEIGV